MCVSMAFVVDHAHWQTWIQWQEHISVRDIEITLAPHTSSNPSARSPLDHSLRSVSAKVDGKQPKVTLCVRGHGPYEREFDSPHCPLGRG